MKVVILAGGLGSRLSEETVLKPKPMVEIGGRPILWHIMKIYSQYGFNEFVICCGYKGAVIKKYFINYYMYQSDFASNLDKKTVSYKYSDVEPWKVTLANTELRTNTSGRILKIRDYVKDEPFFLTYGDGVGNIDLNELLEFHKRHGKTVTITSTKPEGRFGIMQMDEKEILVKGFQEKVREDQGWTNIGFMVMEPGVFDYLGDGSDMLEDGPFRRLVNAEQMAAYHHEGFWSPMDNIKDKAYLEKLWSTGKAPWKIWD